jgi:hypothetical protein
MYFRILIKLRIWKLGYVLIMKMKFKRTLLLIKCKETFNLKYNILIIFKHLNSKFKENKEWCLLLTQMKVNLIKLTMKYYK